MKPGLIISVYIFLLATCIQVTGQSKGINRDRYRVKIEETSAAIKIDGLLDEEPWLKADRAVLFKRVLPIDTGMAAAQTEVMLTYDQNNIYLGIVCYDPLPGKRPVESLRRDFSFGKNDNFIVFIDTYNDQTNGFAFGISPAGAQWDGQQANGGFVNLDWDIKWKSEVKNYDDRWIAEFSIPFRSMRYRGGVSEWGINFSRQDLKTNEKSSWAPMPRQFQTANLAYTGTLVWDKPLPSSGPRFSVIPYVSGKASQDNSLNEDTRYSARAGVDSKIILSTSMNLDLTVNPDYSQVEVDRQQTNLDRYELFFPEKRQFYLENSDLFANLGAERTRPFFSRRIGLGSPVRAGIRLSGQVGNKMRLGLMDLQTGEAGNMQASNFSVATVQRSIFSRSNITAFMVNKQVTGVANDTSFKGLEYNRLAGLEFNLASSDNKWTGKTFYHHSFYPGSSGNASAAAISLTYSIQKLMVSLNQFMVGSEYIAQAGYIKRTGYYEFNPSIQYRFYPGSSRVANHGPTLKTDLFFDPDLSLSDREVQLAWSVEWLNKSTLSVDFKDNYIRLLNPFDPTNTGGTLYSEGEEFKWREAGFRYGSDSRKLFNFILSGRYGGYYSGKRLNMDGELYYRVQPYGSIAVVASFNDIDMPLPYNSARLILIGPRVDMTFTNKLFFTTFVQYNNQIDNMNLNLRLQWRFAPVSDLFIVYTDNSYIDDFRNKNRGLIIKLSYWFN